MEINFDKEKKQLSILKGNSSSSDMTIEPVFITIYREPKLNVPHFSKSNLKSKEVGLDF